MIDKCQKIFAEGIEDESVQGREESLEVVRESVRGRRAVLSIRQIYKLKRAFNVGQCFGLGFHGNGKAVRLHLGLYSCAFLVIVVQTIGLHI